MTRYISMKAVLQTVEDNQTDRKQPTGGRFDPEGSRQWQSLHFRCPLPPRYLCTGTPVPVP